ncbi:DUF3618 domain-containing protein [Actinotalea sp. M2MS4P-6]|uniref:DUF3618 domain-containing protein n=1 Tax=Actinotalea sp. M2MS4P-6 TaxID=2983762 RepID=UPI0021E43579|nr:DUF3618 domain-containing protein [Actinotalea sp. M2MS4P-6]MCV2395270.1 DUF3618 domain-containing protein [Actinotalea sp. M2MS4P-6]
MSGTEGIEADIERTRAELQATVDELAERLNPKANVLRALDEAKVAVDDIRRRVTHEERGPEDPEPTTTGWVVLGAGAAAAAAIVAGVARKL